MSSCNLLHQIRQSYLYFMHQYLIDIYLPFLQKSLDNTTQIYIYIYIKVYNNKKNTQIVFVSFSAKSLRIWLNPQIALYYNCIAIVIKFLIKRSLGKLPLTVWDSNIHPTRRYAAAVFIITKLHFFPLCQDLEGLYNISRAFFFSWSHSNSPYIP